MPATWSQRHRLGLLSGLVAALTMTLVMIGLRWILGISPPPEMVPDRIAPTMSIGFFFGLLGTFGGYNQLKQFGVGSILTGQLCLGTAIGIFYAMVVERGHASTSSRTSSFDLTRHGQLFVAIVVAVLWIVTVGLVWPDIGTSYRGRPLQLASIATVLGLLVAYCSYGLTLMLTYWYLTRQDALAPQPHLASLPSQVGPVTRTIGRRTALAGGAALALVIVNGALLRWLSQRAVFSYDGMRYWGPDIQSMTPNDQFYSVTKNVVDPNIDKSLWRLEVAGLVDQPRAYGFDDIAALPASLQEVTLTCISNSVGDGLMSNAVWKGTPLRSLIEAAGPQSSAVEVFVHGVDGYTDALPIEKALNPTTMVVYEMNGKPLSERHGYPVRLIVPGLYGEKNVKWVTRLEVLDEARKGFYAQQGWGPNITVKTQSRFDGPDFSQPIQLGQTVMLKGTAFAGDRGISRVEVSTDSGVAWQVATIDYAGSGLSWSFWSYRWNPPQAGIYHMIVRATDGAGTPQPSEDHSVDPEGASGYHRVTAQVQA